MKRIVDFCIDHPYWVIGIVLLVTLLFASQIPRIKMDSRVEVMLRHDYPPVVRFIENQESFAAYTDVVVGMIHTDIYNASSLEKLSKICSAFEEIEGIRKVTCILNAKNIEGDESGLKVASLAQEGSVPKTAEEIAELKAKIESWDVYRGALVTADGTGTAMAIVLEEDVETVQMIPIYFKMTAILDKYKGPEKFFISGTKVLEALQSHYMIRDLIVLPPLVVVVLLISLFFFFRNFTGMLLPLVSVGIACIWTFGLMSMVNVPLTMISTALPVALMAVGVGYGVHVIENVFADFSAGNRGKAGIKSALTRIVLPVLVAGLTEVVSFVSLVSIWVVPLTQFGLLSAFGFCVAMLLVLTFIPAVMSAVDAQGRAFIPRHHTGLDIVGPILRKLSYISVHRKGWVFAVSFLVFVVALFLGRDVRSDLNLADNFRERSPIRVADRILNDKFGGTSTYSVVFKGMNEDDVKDPVVLRRMDRLQEELKGLDGVGKVVSVVDFVKRMNQAMHDGDPAYYAIPDTRELVAQYLLLYSFSGGEGELDSFVTYDFKDAQILLQMKSQSGYLTKDVVELVSRFEKGGGGPQKGGFITTGLSTLADEFNRIIVASQLQSFVLSFVLCFLVTALIFRSFKLGVYSMVPLLIPITLDFGIMGATGMTLNAATATVAAIDIGLGIDYCIHFLNRYKHEIKVGATVDEALDIAMKTSGRAIIYNALALSTGFLVLVPSQFVIISQMGILVAIDMMTIAFSALTFLPAIIKVFPPNLGTDTRDEYVCADPLMEEEELAEVS
ncbi:MAG TPA: MMPL family transporter [Deltaproteobacteria bacterium]|nr:MMPL family transporter [Deltaproteobacteria bacterium]HOI07456.1 MMPL family transporter [Deltaproteobacteria bacterium]